MPMNSAPQNPYDAPLASQDSRGSSFPWRALLGVISVLFATALFCLVLFLGPLAWLLRDGLGPDSTTSSGWQAITRMFWCLYWGPATLLATLIFGAAILAAYRLTPTE